MDELEELAKQYNIYLDLFLDIEECERKLNNIAKYSHVINITEQKELKTIFDNLRIEFKNIIDILENEIYKYGKTKSDKSDH